VLFVSSFLLFAIFYILSFCFLFGFCLFISPGIRVNFERNKKYIVRNTIVDKTVAKELKAKGKKQETKSML